MKIWLPALLVVFLQGCAFSNGILHYRADKRYDDIAKYNDIYLVNNVFYDSESADILICFIGDNKMEGKGEYSIKISEKSRLMPKNEKTDTPSIISVLDIIPGCNNKNNFLAFKETYFDYRRNSKPFPGSPSISGGAYFDRLKADVSDNKFEYHVRRINSVHYKILKPVNIHLSINVEHTNLYRHPDSELAKTEISVKEYPIKTKRRVNRRSSVTSNYKIESLLDEEYDLHKYGGLGVFLDISTSIVQLPLCLISGDVCSTSYHPHLMLW